MAHESPVLVQPLPFAQPSGQLAAVSQEDGPEHSTEQAQASLQATPAAQAFWAEQVTVHGRPAPHAISPAQASLALHSTVQEVARPQRTPPAQAPSALQRTRHSTPAGQSTRWSQSSPSQSMAQTSPSQVPIPSQAVAQSMVLSPASGSPAASSGGRASRASAAASMASGPESRPWPEPPGLELSKLHEAATTAPPSASQMRAVALDISVPGSPIPGPAGRISSGVMERKNKRRIIAAVAVLAVAAGGILAWRLIWKRGGAAIEYQTAVTERGSLSSQVTASGILSPLVTVQVGSQVSGRILELKADFNARVEKGQVIARIDPQLFQTEVAKARANHTSARAQVTRAEAELAQANRNHDRTSSLAEQQLVAKADVDSSLAALQTAQASVSAARAMVSQAKAAVEQAETNLALTTIVSPISGIVISRNVDVGQTVAASLQAPTLFTIAEDLAKMEVHTSVAESDVGRLSADMQVEFSVDAHPSERFKGVVKEVRYAPQTVQNVVTYDAVVSVDNSDLKLRPGMTADVTFLLEKRDAVVLMPNTALRFRPPQKVLDEIGWKPPDERGPGVRAGGGTRKRGGGGEAAGGGGSAGPAAAGAGATSADSGGESSRRERASRRLVWKLGKDGVPAPAMVEIGISDGKVTEVVSGLSEGETVIVGIVGAEQPAGQPGGGGPGGTQRDRRFGRFL